MEKKQLVALLHESHVQIKPSMASTRTTCAVVTIFANRTVLARTAAGSIARVVSNMIDSAMALVVEWMHLSSLRSEEKRVSGRRNSQCFSSVVVGFPRTYLHRDRISLLLMTFQANIEIFAQKDFTSSATEKNNKTVELDNSTEQIILYQHRRQM